MSKKNENVKQLNLEETKAQNQELYKQLTNKNEQYIFQLNSRLDDMDYDPIAKEYVINEMLHEIIAGQKSHIPARKIYGTVTEQANHIVGKDFDIPEGEQEKSPTWMIYMDGALLLGGLFSIVNGIGAYQDPSANVGLVQILMNFLLGGLAVLTLTKYSPRQGQTKGMLKYILATVSVMLVWVIAITLILFLLPDILNPSLPPFVIITIGIVSLLAKWYLKKELDIKGTLF
ncbi:MAG TPA: DUF1129 family protein [Atopostipes sp.]|nr:DUF1129 family protein [Atopostipes sp.]